MRGRFLAGLRRRAAPNRNLPPPVAVCELEDDRARQVMGQRLVRHLVAVIGARLDAGRLRCGERPVESRRAPPGLRTSRSADRALRFPVTSTPPRRGHERRAQRTTSGPKSWIRCADAVAAVISCARMRLGRLTGDTATFREISARHWRRPALVFNGRETDTFEIKLAQLSERTAGRAHPGDRRPLVLRLATGRRSREALAAPGVIRNNEHSG
jgi:hypothetical protein